MFYLQSYLMAKKKDIEIQPGFKPGSSEFYSDALTMQLSHLSSGIGAQDRWYLSVDTFQISGWISQSVGFTLH